VKRVQIYVQHHVSGDESKRPYASFFPPSPERRATMEKEGYRFFRITTFLPGISNGGDFEEIGAAAETEDKNGAHK
jgi:hypothetical protein